MPRSPESFPSDDNSSEEFEFDEELKLEEFVDKVEIPDRPTKEDVEKIVPLMMDALTKEEIESTKQDHTGVIPGEITDKDIKTAGKDMSTLEFWASAGRLSDSQIETARVSREGKRTLSLISEVARQKLENQARSEIYSRILRKNGLL